MLTNNYSFMAYSLLNIGDSLFVCFSGAMMLYHVHSEVPCSVHLVPLYPILRIFFVDLAVCECVYVCAMQITQIKFIFLKVVV